MSDTTPSFAQSCDRNARKQLRLEQAAKQAYDTFSSSLAPGYQPAWEQLNQAHQAAWKDVVTFLVEDADCLICGNPLLCPACQESGDDCPFCGAVMECPNCKALEAEKLITEPEPKP